MSAAAGGGARSGLIALLALAVAALLLSPASPAGAQQSGTVDYDIDHDGLIEVDSLAKLNAVRWDLDGNGASANAGYATAFPSPRTGMGCPITAADSDDNDCRGYELTAHLNFDTDSSGAVDSSDDYPLWTAIGTWASPFNTIFDGGGHIISHLHIRASGGDIGLFGSTGASGVIRNVALEDVDIDRSAGDPAFNSVGGLAGSNRGAVERSYATGAVTGYERVGGLVGDNRGTVNNSYSKVTVTGNKAVGGLAGSNRTSSARITNSYAAGAVSAVGMQAGLAWNTGRTKGGLVGEATSDATVTASYWDATASGQAASAGGAGAVSKTTTELQSPTGATGIYSAWSAIFWDFGTASQYPALKYDTNENGVATVFEFGFQGRNTAPSFNEGLSASRRVTENTPPNTNIGLPVEATDAEGDRLVYTLDASHDHAHFAIDSSSGQLKAKGTLNFENKNRYSVVVTVSDGYRGTVNDGYRGTDSITVTIDVGDLAEPPGSSTGLTANPIVNGLRVTWTAPVMTGKPGLTGYQVGYKLSTASTWTAHSHSGTGTTARITGLTAGATYNVRVQAANNEGTGDWVSASGVPLAAGQRVDYDTDDDGLIEVDSLEQLHAMRWDSDGNGAGGGPGHDAVFPDAAAGMGCPSDCTGYELEADLDFDTNGSGLGDSGDVYWNGGVGWAPFWYHGIFEGNRHTVSNLHVNRPDGDQVGLFSTVGTRRGGVDYGEVRNLGLENVDVTGREYVGGLAGRASAPVRRVYTTGEVMGKKMVGGLVGEARNLISETYSKADVTGVGWESSNVGGLVGYLRLGAVKASYATGDVSGMTWVGGLVGHNSSSDDGGVIAGYATGNLGFAGLEDSNAVPGRWVDGFSSRYYLPYTPTWVGGLVGDSSGPVVASYSTGGHPISLARYQPGERKDRSRRDLAYMMEVHWKIGGLVGKSYGRQERDSYWDTVTSRHRPGHKDWVYGKGKTTSELQSVTGYTGIYANWNVDLDGDGAGDDPWDFGSGAHYPTLKVDFNGDGTATAYEFGGQGRTANDHVPLVGNTGVFEVTVPENTPSGAPIFGVTLPLAPADANSYSLFIDAQRPDAGHFSIDRDTGQLSAQGALDYESKDTYRLGITAVGTDSTVHSNGIIIRVTDVSEPPGAPTGVTIVPHRGSLAVAWIAPDTTGKPPVYNYEVTYYHDGDKAKFTGPVTTYTMTYLTPLITYAVRVRARNADGWGPDSAVAYGTPYWKAPSAAATGAEPGTTMSRRSAPPPPGQPASLRATPQADGSTLVTWDAPAEAGDDAFYRVRRRVDAAGGSHSVIARRVQATGSDGVVAYRHEANSRQAGQRHHYSVRAFNGNGKPLGRWTKGVRDNRPPAFAADSTAAFTVAENTAAGATIGEAPTATDPDDGDTLTYLLGGAHADHFAIDADSGQLKTKGALDYESQDSYTVTIIAADGAGLWAGLDATITVTDVKEAAELPRPGNVQAELQADGSVLVTWDAPTEAGADTFYRVRRRVDAADSSYAVIARRVEDSDADGSAEYRDAGGDLEAGQSYRYSVRAFAGSGDKLGPWTEGVSVAIPAAAPAGV